MSDATKQDFYTIFVNRQTYFGMPVSIHAPAWGATISIITAIHSRAIFQSTHPRGVRLEAVRPILASVLFQSTHPRGVRQFDCISNQKAQCISIHAPAWGATRCPPAPRGWTPNFNPRTRVGCDDFHITGFGAGFDFNPRTRVGCDLR